MNVLELREALKNFPDDMKVYARCQSKGTFSHNHLHIRISTKIQEGECLVIDTDWSKDIVENMLTES